MTMLDDPRLAALRSLDPARDVPPEAAHSATAQEALASILASGVTTSRSPTAARPVAPAQRSRTTRRWALVSAVAVVGAGALTVVPGLVGTSAAYASWTAQPTGVSAETLSERYAACRAFLDTAIPPEKPQGPPDPEMVALRADLASVVPVLAERRGDWTFVIMAASSGLEATCLTAGGGTDRTGTGSITTGPGPTLRGSDDAAVVSGGLGTTSDGGFISVSGVAGSQVTGVTAHADGKSVEATVAGGRFGAWWPVTVSGDHPEIPAIRLTLTLADGSTRQLTEAESSPRTEGDAGKR